MTKRHQVWLIDEGHGGHRVQSEGVLKALKASGLDLDVTYIRCTPKIRGFLRPFARSLFSLMNERWALPLAKTVAQFSLPETPPPAFIISSGGRTAFVSRSLAVVNGVPNVFVGNPKPFPAAWFRAVMSPVPIPTASDAILTGIIPNNITPAECRQKAADYWRGAPPTNCWAILIGGANRNHLYDEKDWSNIANAMNVLAQRHGIKWLVATSRRTGKPAEKIFKSTLRPDVIQELVLQSEDDRAVVQPFLGAGEIIFVTQDSLTMLSEAISSGRPVVSIIPARLDLKPDNFMAVMLRKYYGFPDFLHVKAADLADAPLGNRRAETNNIAETFMLRAAEQLRAALKI